MKGQHASRRNLVAQVLQLLDAPHALFSVYHQPVVLKSLQDLPHVDNVLLVVPAPHSSDQTASACTRTSRRGVVMAVFCTSAGFTGIWCYPFLKSILEKTVQPAALAAKSSMLGSGYTSVGNLIQHVNQLPSGDGVEPPRAA